MYLSILKPNPDKPEIPKHKYQIPNKTQIPKFKIPNANRILRKNVSILCFDGLVRSRYSGEKRSPNPL